MHEGHLFTHPHLSPAEKAELEHSFLPFSTRYPALLEEEEEVSCLSWANLVMGLASLSPPSSKAKPCYHYHLANWIRDSGLGPSVHVVPFSTSCPNLIPAAAGSLDRKGAEEEIPLIQVLDLNSTERERDKEMEEKGQS